jgi:hypothetical protein
MGRKITLNALCELNKKLLDLMNCVLEAKQCASTNKKSDNTEWKYGMYKQLLGSTNFHKILKQSLTHNCQKADIRQVPYPGPTKFRYRQGYLENGACKSMDN